MNKQYQFEDFIEIIKKLRSEDGCPWDREQTHESLKSCLIEEAYEFISSLRIFEETNDAENMKEELGDVLLQVVMHSEIAAQEGLFTLQDVVQNVSEKMVRRHPHVFGDIAVENSGQVLRNWEEIKKEEKAGKSWVGTPLREIPKEFPALIRGAKVHKKAAKIYGASLNFTESVEKMVQLTEQLKSAENQNESQTDILGELLMQISNVAACGKINTEQILADKIEEFIEKQEGHRNTVD